MSDPTDHVAPGVTEELPETNMLWRRVISTALTLTVLVGAGWLSRGIHAEGRLHDIIHWLIGYAALLSLIYFCGATMNDITRLTIALKTKRAILASAPPVAQS